MVVPVKYVGGGNTNMHTSISHISDDKLDV